MKTSKKVANPAINSIISINSINIVFQLKREESTFPVPVRAA